ncbi:MAG: hypothetical protein OXI16_13525 [Chloroflexota bacterium]|nr:hypothetical protein [Chloroflexota bacterium]
MKQLAQKALFALPYLIAGAFAIALFGSVSAGSENDQVAPDSTTVPEFHRASLGAQGIIPTPTSRPPSEMPDESACTNGIIIPEETYSAGLARDCRTLLRVVRALTGANGNAPDWSASAPISEWTGVALKDGRVSELALPRQGLQGTLESDITDMTRLALLDLKHNALTGEIPDWVGRMHSLKHLDLSENRLSGRIPDDLRSLTLLEFLNLSGNDLSGDIPGWIDELTQLRVLWMGNNSFSGDIPASISETSNLRHIYLSNNDLTGGIRPVTALEELEYLLLDGNEGLTGDASDLSGHSELHTLTLGRTKITGELADIAKLTDVAELNIAELGFTGKLSELARLTALTDINIAGNDISGTLDELPGEGDIRALFVQGNALAGEITPAFVGRLEADSWLQLRLAHGSTNRFSGCIPEEITQLTQYYGTEVTAENHRRVADRLGMVWCGSEDTKATKGNVVPREKPDGRIGPRYIIDPAGSTVSAGNTLRIRANWGESGCRGEGRGSITKTQNGRTTTIVS